MHKEVDEFKADVDRIARILCVAFDWDWNHDCYRPECPECNGLAPPGAPMGAFRNPTRETVRNAARMVLEATRSEA